MGFFLLGLILLGGGAILAIVAEVPALRGSEDTTSVSNRWIYKPALGTHVVVISQL